MGGEQESDDNDGSKSFISVENGVAGRLPLIAADRHRVGNKPRPTLGRQQAGVGVLTLGLIVGRGCPSCR